MKQLGLKYFTDIDFTIAGLLIFFVWFILLCLWVYKVVPAEKYAKLAELPLKSEGES